MSPSTDTEADRQMTTAPQIPQPLPASFAATPRPVDERVSPDERMSAQHLAGYLGIGESALKAIRLALITARRPDPLTVLDMGCGHGRVLRWIAAAFPAARITACDLRTDGVDFCAETFGAVPVYSATTPTLESFPDRYDLIWVGSLFTHLNAYRWDDILGVLAQLLERDGVLVATTGGPMVAARLRAGNHYGYPAGPVGRSLRAYDETGFGFIESAVGSVDYGLAYATPEWTLARIRRHPDLRVVMYAEALWANHQDVVAVVKRPIDPRMAESPYT